MVSDVGRRLLDHRKSTLARGSRYVTANGVRNGLVVYLDARVTQACSVGEMRAESLKRGSCTWYFC